MTTKKRSFCFSRGTTLDGLNGQCVRIFIFVLLVVALCDLGDDVETIDLHDLN